MLSSQAIVNEVYNEIVSLRVRDIVRNDSARLSCAIRTIGSRRKVRLVEIEQALDQALAYRRMM
jgi:hypothetical protein